MVQINPYAPGSVDKTVVGVANYSKAKAGEAASVLAQGAGHIRDQIASNASQDMRQTFGLLDQVAGSIGHTLGRALSAGQQQSQYLATMAANKLYYQSADAQDALHASLTNDPTVQQSPADYTDKYQALINGDTGPGSLAGKDGNGLDFVSVMDRAADDPNIRNHPNVLADLDGRMRSLVHSNTERARNWSKNAQTDNAVDTGKQTVESIKEFAPSLPADPAAALPLMAQKMSRAVTFAQSDIAAMGPKLTGQTQRDIIKTGTDSYVRSIAAKNANLADADGNPDPLKALINIDVARKQLADPTKFPHLTADEYKAYDAEYDRAQHQQEQNLKIQFTDQSMKLVGWVTEQNIKLDQHREDPRLIQMVTEGVAKTIGEVQANIKSDAAAALPQSVKNVYHEGRLTHLADLDKLQKHVNANYQFQKSEANKATVENRRIAHEVQAEQRHQTTEMRHLEVEARLAQGREDALKQQKIKDARDEALDEMNLLAMQMNDPSNNALTNPKGLSESAAKLSAYIAEAVQSGVLKGHTSSARQLQKQANDVVENLAKINHSNGFFGFGAKDTVQSATGKHAGDVAKREAIIDAQIKRQQFGIQLGIKQDKLSEDPKYQFDDATRLDFRDTAHAVINHWLSLPPSPIADAERDYKLSQIPAMLAKRKAATLTPAQIKGGPAPPRITAQDLLNGPANHTTSSDKPTPIAGFKQLSQADQDKAMKDFLNRNKPAEVLESAGRGYEGVKNFPGLKVQGNLDLSMRPIVHNKDGSYGTEFSTSFDDGKNEVVIPTIFNGEHHSVAQAIKHYLATGEHMGKFARGDYKAADEYAQKLHERQQYLNGRPYPDRPGVF